MQKACGTVNHDVKGKTLTRPEGNKGAGREDLGPKPIHFTGKGDGFHYQ